MRLHEIIRVLESFAPPALQEAYDNTGLQIGDPNREIQGAIICLDVTEEVLEEAIAYNYNLVIAHHPLLFRPLKRLTGQTPVERLVAMAISNQLAIYALHTNLDNMATGVNAEIARRLNLTGCRVLTPMQNQLYKLFTFVPHAHAHAVRQALFSSGAGQIGNYDECSFNTEGYGTFRAGDNTSPFVGTQGIQHREEETRIEVIVPAHRRQDVLKALKDSHPYEEVAYDLVPLANEWAQVGAGLIGNLPEPLPAKDFLHVLKQTFATPLVRHSRPPARPIQQVAVCGGSGAFLLPAARMAAADAFVTADVKYHIFFNADQSILLCDIGHYESEQFTMNLVLNLIQSKIPTFAARITTANTNPVHYY